MTDNPFDDASLAEADSNMQSDYTAPLAWEGDGDDEEAGQFQGNGESSSSTHLDEPGVYSPPREQEAAASQEMTPDAMLSYMRLINVGAAVLMSTAAVINLISLPEFDVGIICIYLWFFALVLCCFETHLKAVSRLIGQNFGFLYHAKGRLLFLVLVATLCFSLGLLGLIAGCALLCAAAFNTYVICKHPEYEEATQKLDLEQSGPANWSEARGGQPASGYAAPEVAAAGAAAGAAGALATWAVQNPQHAQAAAGWVQDNPETARQAAQAGYQGF